MEMPEGWKALEQQQVYAKRLSGIDESFKNRTDEALELMKEMAEVLQAYAADSFDATSIGDMDDDGQGKLARSVLKKFQSWK